MSGDRASLNSVPSTSNTDSPKIERHLFTTRESLVAGSW